MTRQPTRPISLIVAVVIAVVALFLFLTHPNVPAESDAIHDAMRGIEKYRLVSDDDIIDALRRSGDLNGYCGHPPRPYLTVAVEGRRRQVVRWLLEQRVNPNPAGAHPLFPATGGGDEAMIMLLVNAGSRLDSKVGLGDGRTIAEVMQKSNPGLLAKLKAGTHNAN